MAELVTFRVGGLLFARPEEGIHRRRLLSVLDTRNSGTGFFYVDHSDGPTGAEVRSGVAPSFVGGIVVLNGTYNNTIIGNQLYASGGADLGWAQAIPDPNSPIAVVAAPPVIHCNVTVSEGGGGVANHNGNVWSGNTFKHIDACISQQ